MLQFTNYSFFYFRNLQIKFEFTTLNITPDNEYQAILTNCYPSPTCTPSFALLVDKLTANIGIKIITNFRNEEKTMYQWVPYQVCNLVY
jgi:hypothetical protein